MRSVLALGLLSMMVSVTAAPVHHAKLPVRHLRRSRRVTVPNGYAVPGWTDEQTRYWMDNATVVVPQVVVPH
jgi:hypothetical protein